jgi:hypothetical protein
MTLPIDQSKLREIVDTILAGNELGRAEASVLMQFAQLAASADQREHPAEHALMQAIAQHINARFGGEAEDLAGIVRLEDFGARLSWFRARAGILHTSAARDLAFVLAFLVSIADLELVSAEHANLDELQHVLGVDDRRAMDLVILLTRQLTATHAA